MLTVIITNERSSGFIERYSTFFEPYINNGQIAFCYWNEHGKDFKTALPQLSDIVRGQKQWRAVVALPVNETLEEKAEQEFQTTIRNPFDFLIHTEEPTIEESEIPLIRLAQMLGGVPLVNRTYSMKEIRKQDGTIVYESTLNENEEDLTNQQVEWEKLNAKYSFSNDKPVSLFLIAGRIPKSIEIPTETDAERMQRKELDYSRFWYRNRYPSKARFLVKDCVPKGHAHYEDQLFEFWMTVLTFCLVEIPIGSIEAYKLYQIQAVVDKDKVQELLSKYYNRLSRIHHTALNYIVQMKKGLDYADDTVDLESYSVKIPVSYRFDETEMVLISSNQIGLVSDYPKEELPWWQSEIKRSKSVFQKLILAPRVVLDKACSKVKFYDHLPEDAYVNLNEYQMDQLENQLEELEIKILTFHTSNFLPVQKYKKDMNEAAYVVGDMIQKRMNKKMVLVGSVVSLVTYLLGFLTKWIHCFSLGEGLVTSIIPSFVGVFILTGIALITLLYFQFRLKKGIKDYNKIAVMAVKDIGNSSAKFQDYLSSLCTYMRGRSMLDELKKKSKKTTEGIVLLDNHRKHIGTQMRIIESWMSDFHLTVIPDDGSYKSDYFNFDIPSEENDAYRIQLDDYKLDIELMDGSIAEAPYPFIVALKIKREEIFE